MMRKVIYPFFQPTPLQFSLIRVNLIKVGCIILKIELDIEEYEDLTEEENSSLRCYYGNPINLVVKDNGKKIIELNSTFHDAFLIEILSILAEFKEKKKGKRQLESYDNAQTYFFEKENDELVITNFDDYEEKLEWRKSIGYLAFTNAFVKEIYKYLDKLVDRYPEAISSDSFSLMKKFLYKII